MDNLVKIATGMMDNLRAKGYTEEAYEVRVPLEAGESAIAVANGVSFYSDHGMLSQLDDDTLQTALGWARAIPDEAAADIAETELKRRGVEVESSDSWRRR